jgi:antitoxin component YwqK of YwqJK toxin-antitoxin module
MGKIVYGITNGYLLIFELCEDSITNECKLDDVIDPQYALFKTNCVHVKDIIEKKSNKSADVDNINISYNKSYNKSFDKGKITEIYGCEYEDDLERDGIIYFNSKEAALSFGFSPENNNYTGKLKKWYKNGGIEEESNWINGKKHGMCSYWLQSRKNQDLMPKWVEIWNNGSKIGPHLTWNHNGDLESIIYWKDDNIHGLMESWTHDNKNSCFGVFVNGEKKGYHVSLWGYIGRGKRSINSAGYFLLNTDGKSNKHGKHIDHWIGSDEYKISHWNNGNLIDERTLKNIDEDKLIESIDDKILKIVRKNSKIK